MTGGAYAEPLFGPNTFAVRHGLPWLRRSLSSAFLAGLAPPPDDRFQLEWTSTVGHALRAPAAWARLEKR